MIVTLNHEEMDLIFNVSRGLMAMHRGSGLRETFNGIRAEFAVIKFFNYQLGANPPIEFRTEYNQDGGDGGFDFEIGPIRFDVKHNIQELIPKQVFATSAHVLIRASKGAKGNQIFVHGWAPAKRAQADFRNGVEIRWQSMALLPLLFPDRFTVSRLQPRPYVKMPEQCNSIIYRTVSGWNCDFNGNK